jgi:uncharacterized protein (DUF1810 family)
VQQRDRALEPHNLQRFLDAQARIYDQVLEELRAGRKRSHWVWFIFPQIAGLGHSETAKFYAIRSLEEAAAYLQHPLLGPRLLECTSLVHSVAGKTIHDILGSPDDMKFRSCMTLFAKATEENKPFTDALQKYFDGEPDSLTLQRIQ